MLENTHIQLCFPRMTRIEKLHRLNLAFIYYLKWRWLTIDGRKPIDEGNTLILHDDVIKWKHFPRYWPFVWGIHRSPVNSRHKGQWRGAFMFSLICVWINGWVNNREAGDLRRYRAHYDVTLMSEVPLNIAPLVFNMNQHWLKWNICFEWATTHCLNQW